MPKFRVRVKENNAQDKIRVVNRPAFYGADVFGYCGLNTLTYIPQEAHVVRQKGLGLVIVHFDFTHTYVLCCENSMAEFQTGESDVVKRAHALWMYTF